MCGYGLGGGDSGQGQVAGTCECGDEPSGSIKCGEFLDQLKTGYHLKDSALWSNYISKTIISLLPGGGEKGYMNADAYGPSSLAIIF